MSVQEPESNPFMCHGLHTGSIVTLKMFEAPENPAAVCAREFSLDMGRLHVGRVCRCMRDIDQTRRRELSRLCR